MRWVLPSGEVSGADPLVLVVVLVAAVGQEVPGHVHVWSGRRVPEKTRTRLIRPTYGSVVVLTTSATSGPAGSQEQPLRGLPSGLVTGGTACSSGDGNAWVMTSSSSASAEPGRRRRRGSTGIERALATAVSRSSMSTSEVDVLAAEVAVHQGLVLGLGDDPLDERAARGRR